MICSAADNCEDRKSQQDTRGDGDRDGDGDGDGESDVLGVGCPRLTLTSRPKANICAILMRGCALAMEITKTAEATNISVCTLVHVCLLVCFMHIGTHVGMN